MKVQVCSGKSCSGKFSKYISARIENDIKFSGMKNIEVEECCCMWQCKKWANVKINNQIHNYSNPAKISLLVHKEYK